MNDGSAKQSSKFSTFPWTTTSSFKFFLFVGASLLTKRRFNDPLSSVFFGYLVVPSVCTTVSEKLPEDDDDWRIPEAVPLHAVWGKVVQLLPSVLLRLDIGWISLGRADGAAAHVAITATFVHGVGSYCSRNYRFLQNACFERFRHCAPGFEFLEGKSWCRFSSATQSSVVGVVRVSSRKDSQVDMHLVDDGIESGFVN